MTGARYPIAERGDEGAHERRQALFELDQLLNQGSPPRRLPPRFSPAGVKA